MVIKQRVYNFLFFTFYKDRHNRERFDMGLTEDLLSAFLCLKSMDVQADVTIRPHIFHIGPVYLIFCSIFSIKMLCESYLSEGNNVV